MENNNYDGFGPEFGGAADESRSHTRSPRPGLSRRHIRQSSSSSLTF